MEYKEYQNRRMTAEEQHLNTLRDELEAEHADELAALIEEIYNEDLEVIG